MLAAALMLSLAACGKSDRPNSDNPITLTVWHVYEEEMKQAFDALVDEFNEGEGQKPVCELRWRRWRTTRISMPR
jgi:multiple sugar transport system substrate-binding protein